MSSPITPYQPGQGRFYGPSNRDNQARKNGPPQTGQRSVPTPDASAAVPELGSDLSSEEKQMIYKQFPPSPETSMRIYDRDQGKRQIRPDGLGSRIDLHG